MEQTQATKNLSDWFNLSEQKPWEPGVYEFQSNNGTEMFAYWNGDKAFMGTPISFGIRKCISIAIDDFEEGRTSNWSENVCKWRGLASDPSAKPKARGNRKVTRYVVAETVGLYTSHIDPNAIHGVYTSQEIADGVAKKLRSSGHFMARVFKTKRFRSPDGA